MFIEKYGGCDVAPKMLRSSSAFRQQERLLWINIENDGMKYGMEFFPFSLCVSMSLRREPE